jgi:hypothetical protein
MYQQMLFKLFGNNEGFGVLMQQPLEFRFTYVGEEPYLFYNNGFMMV